MPELNNVSAQVISSRLRPTPERPDPVPLQANASLSYQGSVVLGLGFTLTPDERDELIRKNCRNGERIFPYLGGREVNTSPTQDFERYVISFGDMSLDEAGKWPDLLAIVREKVKPERDRLKNNPDGQRWKQTWWQFGRNRNELYAALAGKQRCLVAAIHSKHLIFSIQKTDRIFSNAMNVFPLDTYSHFATLQSRLHEPWARLLSSTMKNDLRYSASDCFETFPFPRAETLSPSSPLEAIGKQLYDARAAFMVERNHGLTATYNDLKNPDVTDPTIEHLRELHRRLDHAVLEAYGWADIHVPPFTDPVTDSEFAQKDAFENQIIDRLYILNQQRAAEEEN